MVPSMWLLPMATNYQWLGGVHYNGSCCDGDGRSWPTVPSIHVHLHCYCLAWVLCHTGHVEGQNCRFLKLIAIVTLSLS